MLVVGLGGREGKGRGASERGRVGHYSLEAEPLEHREIDGERVATAVDAGCDELE